MTIKVGDLISYAQFGDKRYCVVRKIDERTLGERYWGVWKRTEKEALEAEYHMNYLTYIESWNPITKIKLEGNSKIDNWRLTLNED